MYFISEHFFFGRPDSVFSLSTTVCSRETRRDAVMVMPPQAFFPYCSIAGQCRIGPRAREWRGRKWDSGRWWKRSLDEDEVIRIKNTAVRYDGFYKTKHQEERIRLCREEWVYEDFGEPCWTGDIHISHVAIDHNDYRYQNQRGLLRVVTPVWY